LKEGEPNFAFEIVKIAHQQTLPYRACQDPILVDDP
jgi:hypothetical protein